MRRGGLVAGCFLLVTLACTQIWAAEVAELIPEDSVLALVFKDMTALRGKVVDLANKVSENAGKDIPDPWDRLLNSLQIQAQVTRTRADGTQFFEQLPTTIDRSRPVVGLIPNPGEGQKHEFLLTHMIPVTDYPKFLEEVAQVRSTPQDVRKPVQTVDGFDLIGDDDPGKGLYFTKRGDYAVIARSTVPLKALRDAAPRNLQQSLSGDSKKIFTTSDVAAYLNCDQAEKTFHTDIQQFQDRMQAQMDALKNQPGDPGVPMPMDMAPQDAAKIFKAEVELLMEMSRQVDFTVLGANFTPEDVLLTCLVTAHPNTMIANFLAAQKTGQLQFMSLLDNTAWFAGCCEHPSGSAKLLQDRLLKFMVDSGLTAVLKDFNTTEYADTMAQIESLINGNVAFALLPPVAPDAPLINLVEVVECKDPAALRAVMRKYAADQMLGGVQMLPGATVTSTTTENVEPGIDRTVTEVKMPDNQPADPAGQQAAIIMKLIYGDKIVMHDMVVGKCLVLSLGDPTTATVKAMAQKVSVSAAAPGNLTASNGYKRALAGLPEPRVAVGYLSLTGLINAAGPKMTALMGIGPQMKFPMPPAQDESGIGMTLSINGGTARMDARIPVQELVNVRKMLKQAQQDLQGKPGN